MPASSLKNWGKSTHTILMILFHLAAFILSLGGFIFPEGGSPDDKNTLLRIGTTIVAVVIGIIFAFVQLKDQRKQAKKWILISSISLLLFIATSLTYRYLSRSLTCKYDISQVTIGTEYTDRGAKYLRDNPNISCETIISNFGGETEVIWTRASINRSQLILESTFLGSILLFAITLLGVAQAIYSSGMRALKSKKNSEAKSGPTITAKI